MYINRVETERNAQTKGLKMDQLKATKTRTLPNGITVWQIATTSGKIIIDESYRGKDDTEEQILSEFRSFLKSKSCNSDITVQSYYKNALQGCAR
jgi:hypothetical protein